MSALKIIFKILKFYGFFQKPSKFNYFHKFIIFCCFVLMNYHNRSNDPSMNNFLSIITFIEEFLFDIYPFLSFLLVLYLEKRFIKIVTSLEKLDVAIEKLLNKKVFEKKLNLMLIFYTFFINVLIFSNVFIGVRKLRTIFNIFFNSIYTSVTILISVLLSNMNEKIEILNNKEGMKHEFDVKRLILLKKLIKISVFFYKKFPVLLITIFGDNVFIL